MIRWPSVSSFLPGPSLTLLTDCGKLDEKRQCPLCLRWGLATRRLKLSGIVAMKPSISLETNRMQWLTQWLIRKALCVLLLVGVGVSTLDAQLTDERVRRSIDAGKRYLLSKQRTNGSWPDEYPYPVGGTVLATA